MKNPWTFKVMVRHIDGRTVRFKSYRADDYAQAVWLVGVMRGMKWVSDAWLAPVKAN